MRAYYAVSVGWVLLVSHGCGGEKFESQAGKGGESTGGAETAEGGAALGGSAGAVAGAPTSSGGTETGGVAQASGGQSSGGVSTGGVAEASGGQSSGGTETGGVAESRGGHPSGGVPSGGVAVVTGGTSIGGVPTGGVRTGGAPTGGMSAVTGGLSSGGRSTGGAPSGGVVSGGRPSGGVPNGGFTVVTGGTGTGGDGTICACGLGLTCCNGTCVNLKNDIHNCGTCNTACAGPNPFCGDGVCGKPPCSGAACAVTQLCCGGLCCDDTQLCCNVPSSVSAGLQCVTPVNGTCPVGCPTCTCASPDTSIATPGGPRSIASLAEGELVYSVDRGRVVAVPVVRTRKVAATNHHVVVRVTLTNGSLLEISAPHPTADGRLFGELRAGDQLGGFEVARVELVPYGHAFTYDILPASDSGTYFAEGALVGSTLGGRANLGMSVTAP
jgi:hypothetical protein